jgi:hypothetical protein
MNCLEASIIIKKEIDKCNEKIKKYEIKYNTDKTETLKNLYDYLNNNIFLLNENDQKFIIDDINTLKKYLDIE